MKSCPILRISSFPPCTPSSPIIRAWRIRQKEPTPCRNSRGCVRGEALWRRPPPPGILCFGSPERNHQRMTKTEHKDHRKILDETATSIKKLVLDLENRETEGRPINATEIQLIASRLQVHVEDLLAASRGLRDEKSEK